MSKKLKETSDRVWLAGLGALAVAEQEGNDLFQQLVKKGLEVEDEKALAQGGASSSKPRQKKLEVSDKLSFSRAPVKTYKLVDRIAPKENAARKAALVRYKKEREFSPLHQFLPTAEENERIEARQARRLAAARRVFLKEFGSLGKPVSECERLLRERKIFAVTHRDNTYVPSFQFDEKGKPRPAVERVIQILGKDTSDWGLALWFTAANGSLDDKRPVDLLSSHPEEVVQAAEQEAAELVF
ncbi:MAG: phasin family protein [Thermoanaerobaculia bacterium]